MNDASAYCTYDNIIAKTTYRYGINLSGGILKNGIVAGAVRSGLIIAGQNAQAFNCTFYGVTNAAYYGIHSNSAINTTTAIVNCVSTGNAGNDFQWTYTPTTVSNNASEDGTGDDQGTGSITGVDPTAVFTDAANGDFSLKAGDNDLVDAGTNTDAPSSDIAGTSRPQNTTTDIGAFERAFAAAGGGGAAIFNPYDEVII